MKKESYLVCSINVRVSNIDLSRRKNEFKSRIERQFMGSYFNGRIKE